MVIFAEGCSVERSETNHAKLKDPGKTGGTMAGKRTLLTHPVEMDNSAAP